MIINTYIPNNDLGLGDFLRGSYWLYLECQKRHIEFEMDFSKHPMRNFLFLENNRNFEISDVKVLVCSNTLNYNGMENILKKILDEYNCTKEVYLCANMYIDITIIKPSQSAINFLNERIKVKNDFNQYLDSLNLKKTLIFHLRLGDDLLKNARSLNKYEQRLMYNIVRQVSMTFLRYKEKKVVIISDNEVCRSYIKKYLPKVIIRSNIPVHLGFCSDEQLEQIRETLIDFYIIKEAQHIFKYSVYEHASGFSNWAALLGKVPYTFILKNPISK